MGENSEMEDVIKNCAGNAYVELQARGQEEIDSVVGSGRLPDFEDRENLPYVNALIAETMRWNPVVPLALVHRATQDDVYDGYFIPAGSTIVANAWAMLHAEELYGPNPMTFDPDRFMKRDGKNPPDPSQFAFGFGRSTFTITKATDEDGKEIIPEVEYLDGNIRFVASIRFDVRLRQMTTN
ncbi:hypothetical protein V5O48_016400 [Marasmius crinis-equi]|uniref:Cytochrome P450 n=1 Tax=Marasmius crinis-equi TaxID=585013 RepID=A0ABR3ES46_9AGAR